MVAFEIEKGAGGAVLQNQKYWGEVVDLATAAVFVSVFAVFAVVNVACGLDSHIYLILRGCCLSQS